LEAAQKLHPSYTVQVENTTLSIIQNDPLALDAEALLCYSSTSLTLHSNLAQRIVAEGGPLIRPEGAKHAPAVCGVTLVLPAGKLPNRYLLVAITNTLRNPPTVENLQASLFSACGQIAHHRMQSLVVPVLRIGRALTLESTVRSILSPLIDHCCGETPLRQIYLVLDEESELGLMGRVCSYLESTIESLLELGRLRARAACLQQAESQLQRFDLLQPEVQSQILRAQLEIQRELLVQLDRRRAGGRHDYDTVANELQRCTDEIERLCTVLELRKSAPLLARAVGE